MIGPVEGDAADVSAMIEGLDPAMREDAAMSTASSSAMTAGSIVRVSSNR